MNVRSRSESSSDHWENYWGAAGADGDGRDAAVTGAARSEAFQAAWRAFFRQANVKHENKAHVLRMTDLACGAGVVTDAAIKVLAPDCLARSCFIGVDYSLSAARQYSAKFGLSGAAAAFGVVGDALMLPFEAASVDVAVSQFGLEYAGPAAVAEAAHLMAPDGEIMCITHYRSGAIERECSENLYIADKIISSEALGKVRAIFAKPADPQTVQDVTEALQTLRGIAAERPSSAGLRLLTRLRTDLTRLVARRAAFDPGDVIGWLDANMSEISMYADRMRSMTEAALDTSQIGAVVECWKTAGLDVQEPSVITMEGASSPAAWQLRAGRSGN